MGQTCTLVRMSCADKMARAIGFAFAHACFSFLRGCLPIPFPVPEAVVRQMGSWRFLIQSQKQGQLVDQARVAFDGLMLHGPARYFSRQPVRYGAYRQSPVRGFRWL